MRFLLLLLLWLAAGDAKKYRRKPGAEERAPQDVGGWRPASSGLLAGMPPELDLHWRDGVLRGRCEFDEFSGKAKGALASRFRKSLKPKRAPSVVTAFADGWEMHTSWRREQLLERHGDVQVADSMPTKIAAFGPNNRRNRTLREYVSQYMSGPEVDFRGDGAADADCGDMSDPVPTVFDRSAENLAYSARDEWPFPGPNGLVGAKIEEPLASLGPSGAGVSLHIHGASWLALAHGSKLWLVYPPEGPPTENAYKQLRLRSVAAWFEPSAALGGVSPWSKLEPNERPMVCVQGAGELVVVPKLWWHATLNLGDAVGLGAQADVYDMPLSQLASAFPESAHALAMAGNDAFAQGRRQEAAEGELAIAALSAKSDQELAMASSQFQTLQEGSDNEDELQAQGAAHFEASLSADPEHFGHVRGYVIELLQPPSPAAQRARAEGVLVEAADDIRDAAKEKRISVHDAVEAARILAGPAHEHGLTKAVEALGGVYKTQAACLGR